jgi:PAS domain-containing protein
MLIDCRISATLITLGNQINSHAVRIGRDVTEEHATNAQFAAAFHLTPDFISISRLSDGRYVQVNEAFERITGFNRDEVIGRTSLELGIWHRADQRLELAKAFESELAPV